MASVWRWADLLAIVFFATHLPISLLIDGQALIDDANAHLVPSACKTALEYWITFSGDTLMRDRPLWFRSLVAAELSLQGTRSMRDCHEYMGHLREPTAAFFSVMAPSATSVSQPSVAAVGSRRSTCESKIDVGLHCPLRNLHQIAGTIAGINRSLHRSIFAKHRARRLQSPSSRSPHTHSSIVDLG